MSPMALFSMAHEARPKPGSPLMQASAFLLSAWLAKGKWSGSAVRQLMEKRNYDKWCASGQDAMKPKELRILFTWWFGDAWTDILNKHEKALLSAWQRTGSGVHADDPNSMLRVQNRLIKFTLDTTPCDLTDEFLSLSWSRAPSGFKYKMKKDKAAAVADVVDAAAVADAVDAAAVAAPAAADDGGSSDDESSAFSDSEAASGSSGSDDDGGSNDSSDTE